ncbi:proenkephalin-A [Oryzias melastigma]|nr:proenkephalin-A [Oryzias melastigma]
MAVHARSLYLWMLALCACASPSTGADCGKECALCVVRLQRQQPASSALACSLECGGGLDSQRLRLCQDFLLGEGRSFLLDAELRTQQEGEGAILPIEDAAVPPQEMDQKFDNFKKRYGGFMSRRSPTPEGVLDDAENQEEEENIRLEILKLFSTAGEHSREREGQGGEAVKRYGGFMRRAEGGEGTGSLLEAVLDRGLKKRYGGFMRRVGRPEWLVDGTKNGGVFKRAWENGSGLQKRYGGFMD